MKRLLLVLTLLTTAAAFLTAGGALASPRATCTADLLIFTTSTGDVTTAGNTTIFHDSGVGGRYTSGFLSGYTLTGAQNIVLNNATQRGVLEGQFVATSADSSITVRYTGSVALGTGAARGHFATTSGTGAFANFHWIGDITAQLTSLTPPTFVATDSGFCLGA
jgi:hypothetical protein